MAAKMLFYLVGFIGFGVRVYLG